MKIKFKIFLIICILFSFSNAQNKNGRIMENMIILDKNLSLHEIINKSVVVKPSARQYEWQKLEFISFIHFGMNTFTNQEWGRGDESPQLFNPQNLNAKQWVKVIKEAGIKGLILTAKHHDGFCLWPSKYTEHSVKNSPWRKGRGDLVKEVSDACKEYGVPFGIYLSPWDRHEKTFGNSSEYNKYFLNQLRELLSNYGKIFEVWFDGANGEGPNGKKQVYDWESYYNLIRELQPESVISIMGPDVRWVGTESGYGRETEWSVLPDIYRDQKLISENSQKKSLESAFIPRDLTGEDLGSREKLMGASSLVWYPAETDVSIRPGWFYHREQDDVVKTPEKLIDIYFSSVGRNSVLLLNIPPDKNGLINENDVRNLNSMKKILDQTFKNNLAKESKIRVSNEKIEFPGSAVLSDSPEDCWMMEDSNNTGELILDLSEKKIFDRIVIQENIIFGQRVEKFQISAWINDSWQEIAKGTTIGYKRILSFNALESDKIKFNIVESRANPAIQFLGVYKAPLSARFEPSSCSFEETLKVKLICDSKNAKILYTLDGMEPGYESKVYSSPIILSKSAKIKTVILKDNEISAVYSEQEYIKSKKIERISFGNKYSSKYSGSGDSTIINGIKAKPDFNDREFLGFEGDDFNVILDLGEAKNIKMISIGFLQQQGSWIFYPESISVSVSDDNSSWRIIDEITNKTEKIEKVEIRNFQFENINTKSRYLKIYAKNIGKCPSWHPGSNDKAWLFVDEIIIR